MIGKFAKQIMQRKVWSLLFLVSLAITACLPGTPVAVNPTSNPASTPQATQAPTASREAQVQSVEIQVLPGNPAQVNAIVRGNLSESCAVLGESQVTYASNTFQIKVFAVSPTDRGCAQITTPFETTIPLDTSGLPEGSYTVNANGVSAVFTWPAAGASSDTATPTALPTGVPTSQACTDSAAFVADVTIPDNTVVAPNTPITKTWRLKNTGSCTWDNHYLVAYLSGTTMTQQPGYWIVQQGQTVAPGQTVDISVGLTSPVENGDYASYWGLKNENGQLMPIQGGAQGNSFYVKIKVNDGKVALGNITGTSIDIDFEQGSGTPCTAGATYLVHVYITADGPTKGDYLVVSSSGQGYAGYFVDPNTGASYRYDALAYEFEPEMFGQGGTKTVTLPFRFVGPYSDPANITVSVEVNSGETYSAKLRCQQ